MEIFREFSTATGDTWGHTLVCPRRERGRVVTLAGCPGGTSERADRMKVPNNSKYKKNPTTNQKKNPRKKKKKNPKK